jgi:hypothetical protein
MDANDKSQYGDMRDHDLIVITVTKLEGLETKVDQALQDMKDEREAVAGRCTAENTKIDGLEKRVTVMETTWKVIIGILVVVVPTVIAIVWDLVR